MKIYQIKLTPFSLFQNFPPSDTIFGAICWGIRALHDATKLTKMLEDFQNNPKFVLSSSFPFFELNGKQIAFYPKPINPGLLSSDINEMVKNKVQKVDIITEYKKFKKAEYVSSSIFNKILSGFSERMLFEQYMCNVILKQGSVLIGKEDFGNGPLQLGTIFKKTLVQKNSIDRLTMSTGEEGQTFYQEEYSSVPPFKLHFLMKTNDMDFFKPVFRYLEDKGIGGNRSTGKGRFRIEVLDEFSIRNYNSHKFINLSRFIPEIAEINVNSKIMFYEIFPWRSKVDSDSEFKGEDVWKSRVMYLKEGSCIEAIEKKEFYGRMPVVKEIKGDKIYQNGLAFPVFGNFGGTK